MIKGLILKDFMNIKSYKSTIVFFILIFMVTGFSNGTALSFLPVSMIVCFGMMAISSFSYDHLANSECYLLTFPLTRKDLVKARYFYALLMLGIGALLGNVFILLFEIVQGNSWDMMADCLLSSFGSVLAMMGLQSFQIPIMYKFGAEKARLIQMVFVIVGMFALSGMMTFFSTISPTLMEHLSHTLSQYGLAIIAVFVIVFYVVSYRISVQILAKKEI